MADDDLITHRLEGEGETVLFLNGGMMSIPSWEPVVSRFRPDYRVLRCDFRGQLMSPGEPPPSLEGHVADVVALLDALGIDTAHVIGASFGAEVGLLLSAFHPDRVRSLAAVTATHRHDESFVTGAERLQEACRRVLEGGERGTLHDVMTPDIYSAAYIESHTEELQTRRSRMALLPDSWYAGIIGLLDAVKKVDLTAVLGGIRCPCLVLSAEKDLAMPAGSAEALAAAIPGARLEILAGCGHALVMEEKDRMIEICQQFLKEVQS